MLKSKTIFGLIMASLVLVLAPNLSHAKKKNQGGGFNKDRVARDFNHADTNGDRRLSREEWNRRGNFDRLDRNGDGELSLKEVRFMYLGHDEKNYAWPPHGMPEPSPEIDPAIATDEVGHDALDKETMCGLGRSSKCSVEPQFARGLIETGTGPVFPTNALCPGIDDYWAMDYASKRNRETYHGGIDLPVPWGTPMRAVAAGSVVAKFKAEQSKRGTEIVIRHSPEQTGLPMWTYSAYGHLDAMPDLEIGQRVKMGQILGPTGNSGISAKGSKGSAQSSTRRPAIHLALFYADTPQYVNLKGSIIIPVDGRWLDPMAFYRQKEPFDSHVVKALPDHEKGVEIPILFVDGTTFPENTKMIWPYSCQKP